MINVIVATHGPLAEALLASGRMVYGELPHVYPVTLSEQQVSKGLSRRFLKFSQVPGKALTAFWCCVTCKAVPPGMSPAIMRFLHKRFLPLPW